MFKFGLVTPVSHSVQKVIHLDQLDTSHTVNINVKKTQTPPSITVVLKKNQPIMPCWIIICQLLEDVAAQRALAVLGEELEGYEYRVRRAPLEVCGPKIRQKHAV